MEIVTGRTGTPHVTSMQHRNIIYSICGADSCVSEIGEKMAVELASNNVLKIKSGVLFHHGCVFDIPYGTYDEVSFNGGTSGMMRKDLVVARYQKNESDDLESVKWVVIQGVSSAANPQVPAFTDANMQLGDLVDDCPFAVLTFDGVNVSVDTLLESMDVIKYRKIYPVGSIYMSIDPINPADKFGGTWAPYAPGRTLVGVDASQSEFNAAEKTGGEKTHVLKTNEIPNHNHKMASYTTTNNMTWADGSMSLMTGNFVIKSDLLPTPYDLTESTGGDQAHNNLQPYITCYMWKRTA